MCKRKLHDKRKFRDIVNDTFFYSFYDNEQFIGCIYYYYRGNKLFVNAYANKQTLKQKIDCFRMSFNWFDCDIYAETKHKEAILVLLRCGFRKVQDNIYKKGR